MGIYDRDWYRQERKDARRAERERENRSLEKQIQSRTSAPPDLPLHPIVLAMAVAGICGAIYAGVRFFFL